MVNSKAFEITFVFRIALLRGWLRHVWTRVNRSDLRFGD